MPIKISIVGGDQKTSLDSVCEKIPAHLDGFFATGEEAIRHIPKSGTSLALVNFKLPCMDGWECAKKLKTMLPHLPVLMFSTGTPRHTGYEEFIFPALHAGASGYLPGHLPSCEFTSAILQFHGTVRRPRRMFVMYFDSDKRLSLSARYWGKIMAMLNAPTLTINYHENWREVVVSSGKVASANTETLLPPLTSRAVSWAV